MSDTQALLSKISALRQRLEQARMLSRDPSTEEPATTDSVARLRQLQHHVRTGSESSEVVDGSLRQLQLTSDSAPPAPLPNQLTLRARRVIERGRELLARLRELDGELDAGSHHSAGAVEEASADPLGAAYHEIASMIEAVLRMVQAFPDSAPLQLQLCDGPEAVLAAAAQRLGNLVGAAGRRRLESERIDTLARLLVELSAGRMHDPKPFVTLSEGLIADAQEGLSLRFLHADLGRTRSEPPEGEDAAASRIGIPSRHYPEAARFVACHALTAAQVVARLVAFDPDMRQRPLEPVLATLLKDVGMLSVPIDVLRHPEPLDHEQRRAVEGHVRIGVTLTARLFPEAVWLAEAIGMHHERVDGTGYPCGLRERQLPPMVRLLTVCDIYAALCVPRPHRPARETRTALADTLLLSDQGALDRQHAERLLYLSFYPIGSVVELADGAMGVVVATHLGRRELMTPARPVVALLTDARGRLLAAPRHLDLAQCEERSIVRSLPPDEGRARFGRRYPELAA